VIDRKTVFIGSMNFDPRSDALNTEIGIVIESPQLAKEVLRLMNLDKLQSAYRVRLSPTDSRKIEWVGMDDFKEVVWQEEPDVDIGMRLYLQLVAPFVKESML
jgi:putative cardiolipin synthase